MSSKGPRFKAWVKRLQRQAISTQPLEPNAFDTSGGEQLTSSVVKYYQHKAKTALPVFYRFAIQTRSLAIRDMFAKVSSKATLDLDDLLEVISHHLGHDPSLEQQRVLQRDFNSRVLLALADLLANTAQDGYDTHSSIRLYEFVQVVFGDEPFSSHNKLQYVEALNEIGYYERSEYLGEHFEIDNIAPLQQELLYIQRQRRTDSVYEWLNALNDLYRTLGLTPLQLLPDEAMPLMDRLTAGCRSSIDGPKVSIIMPTYSPGPGIKTAVRSLLEQTWQNIEIIIVDDASPAEFRDTFRELGQCDSRIRILHQDRNSGAYVARNTGLEVACGEFVTTHDDDDWSHPDKIASQVSLMLEKPEIVATTSAHIRTTDELHFRRVNGRAQFLQMNYSSLMFRRSLIADIGAWDTVNRGGDSEFYTRIKEVYGSERILGIHDRPLSYSRVWDGSLTSGEMSRGFFAYSRLLYRWAFRQWYWDAKKQGIKPIRKSNERRPYAIPSTFEAGQRHKHLGHFDVIYVTDFFRQATYADRAVHEIEILADAGLRVGYMHLYSPRTNKPAGFSQRLFDLQMQNRVTQVSYNDHAETSLLVVLDSSIGMFLDQLRSAVVSYRSVLIDQETPGLLGTERRTPRDLVPAIRNLERCFNTPFEAVGASSEDQRKVLNGLPNQRVLPDSFIWTPVLRDRHKEICPPAGRPIVGFHSYGNHYRWPSTTQEFELIYNSSEFTTRFYGNIQSARKKYGSKAFESAEVVTYSESNEEEFLAGINFWIYYPNRRLNDQLWEPVLKALQAGKIVILPHRLKKLYGDAALYCSAHEIADVVLAYSADVKKYVAQARIAQDFVRDKFLDKALLNRVKGLSQV